MNNTSMATASLDHNPLKSEEEQLFFIRSPYRRSTAVNRILSKQERRIQYRILCHIAESAERGSLALAKAMTR
jgi:hypothetical protein